MPFGREYAYGRGKKKTPATDKPRITIPQTGEADTAGPVKPRMMKRGKTTTKPTVPKPPASGDIAVEETDQVAGDLSAALLKGAALVPPFSGANTLRGILGGAGVGLEVGDSLARYKKKKERASLAKDALKMSPPTGGGDTLMA